MACWLNKKLMNYLSALPSCQKSSLKLKLNWDGSSMDKILCSEKSLFQSISSFDCACATTSISIYSFNLF